MKATLSLILLLFAGPVFGQVKQLGPSQDLGGFKFQSQQLNICNQQAFAKTVTCTIPSFPAGWWVVVHGFAANTSALNAPTAGCATMSAQTGTTTTDAQQWSISSAVTSAAGTCAVTLTTTSAGNVEMALTAFALSPLRTNGVVDATVTTANYATGFHGSGYSAPSVTGVTNGDIYLSTSYQNGGAPPTNIDSTASGGTCTGDLSVQQGGAGALYMSAGHCIVPTAQAFAPHWTPGGTGNTYASSTIALQP